MERVRQPAVAGMFYPRNPRQLASLVDDLIAGASPCTGMPAAVIAPHAGYVYSGGLSASAIAALRTDGNQPRRVAVFGPAHRSPVHSMAVPTYTAFRTPLGTVPVDTDAVSLLSDDPDIVVSDAAHEQEHSIEVLLPILQRALGAIELIPIAVGRPPVPAVERIMDLIEGLGSAAIVVSTDLSHFMPLGDARATDAATARRIEALDYEGIGDFDACGAPAARGLLAWSARRGLHALRIAMATSADAGGPSDRVVGYGAWAFVRDQHSHAAQPRADG